MPTHVAPLSFTSTSAPLSKTNVHSTPPVHVRRTGLSTDSNADLPAIDTDFDAPNSRGLRSVGIGKTEREKMPAENFLVHESEAACPASPSAPADTEKSLGCKRVDGFPVNAKLPMVAFSFGADAERPTLNPESENEATDEESVTLNPTACPVTANDTWLGRIALPTLIDAACPKSVNETCAAGMATPSATAIPVSENEPTSADM